MSTHECIPYVFLVHAKTSREAEEMAAGKDGDGEGGETGAFNLLQESSPLSTSLERGPWERGQDEQGNCVFSGALLRKK